MHGGPGVLEFSRGVGGEEGLLGWRKGGMGIFVRLNYGAVVRRRRAKDMLATVHLECMETWKSGGHG